MRISKKKISAFIAAAVALAMTTGSWAYFTSNTTIDNELYTKNYGVRTVEEFTPEQDMEPGAKITKEVTVVNTGDYDLVARIKIDEKWERETAPGSGVWTAFKTIANNGPINTVVFDSLIPSWTAVQPPLTATPPALFGYEDGLTAPDETVVYKSINADNTFAGTEDWLKGADGYYYYKPVLEGGDITSTFMDHIVPASNMDMGKYIVTEYYSLADPATVNPADDSTYGWVEVPPTGIPAGVVDDVTFRKVDKELDPAASGYANARYTLSITTEVCQATQEAVNATWTTMANPSDIELIALKTSWNLV